MDILQRGIVRLFRRVGNNETKTLGTGFIAHKSGLIITCAHVLDREQGVPEGKSQIQLEFCANRKFGTAMVVTEHWRGRENEDTAILQLCESISLGDFEEEKLNLTDRATGCKPVVLPLAYSKHLLLQSCSGRRLRTFGYPSAKSYEGLPGDCFVVGTTQENGFEVFAIQSAQVSSGFSGSPVWDDAIGGVVGVNVSRVKLSIYGEEQLEAAFFTPIEVYRNICDRLSLPQGEPYRNLDVFEESHFDYYFGREKASEELVCSVLENNFVAIIGFSGSGKSSLVRAGLKKQLMKVKNRLSDRPRVTFLAGPNPLLSLMVAIEKQTVNGGNRLRALFGLSSTDGMDKIRMAIKEKSVEQITRGLQSWGDKEPFVLICDQFERLYTGDLEPNARKRFISVLTAVPCDNVKIIIVVRSDYYYSQVLYEIGMAKAIGDAEVVLKSMKSDELRDAIELPARMLFRYFQTGLVESMIFEVGERPGDLPLLQFALTELWRKDNMNGGLTVATYEDIGLKNAQGCVIVPGIRGAIIRRAEEYYYDLKSDEDRKRFRFLFCILISSRYESSGLNDLSRRVLESELDSKTQELADALTSTFLLTAGEDTLSQKRTYEVAHEALIRSWPKLEEWGRLEKSWNMWYQTSIFPLYKQWINRNRHPDCLIRSESVLSEIQHRKSENRQRFAGEIDEYVSLSVDRARRQGFFRRVFIFGSAVLVLVILISLIVINQENNQRRVVASRDLHQRGLLALQAHENLEAQIFFSKALALDDRPDTRERLIETLAHGARLDSFFQFEGVAVGMDDAASRVFIAKSGAWFCRGLIAGHLNSNELANGSIADLCITKKAEISHDGHWIAWETQVGHDSSGPNDLHVRNVLSGQERVFPADDRPISAIIFSPSSDLLGFATERGEIRLIDLLNLSMIPFSSGLTTPVWGLAISPDNKFIAACGTNYELRLYDREKNIATQLKGHTDTVFSVAFSPDGQTLASGSTDSTIRLWEVGFPMNAPRIFSGDQGQSNCLAFSSSGQFIAAGCEDNTIRIWDIRLAIEVHKFNEIEGKIYKVAFDSSEKFVTACGARDMEEGSGWLGRWQLNVASVARQMPNLGSPATAAVFGHEGKALFVSGQDGIVREWSWPNLKNYRELSSGGSKVNCLAANGKFPLIAWADDDHALRIYNYSDKFELKQIGPGPQLSDKRQFQQIWSVAFNREGLLLASANFDRTVTLFEIDPGLGEFHFKRVFPDPLLPKAPGAAFAVAFGNNSDLASAGGNGMLCLWDIGVKSNPKIPIGEFGEVYGLDFSPDGRQLATGSSDRQIRIWDMNNVSLGPRLFSGHTALVDSVSYSPRGRWLASGSNDRTVRLWDLSTGISLILRGANGPIWWVSFSPDGRSLVAAGLDGCIRVWSMEGIEHILGVNPRLILEEGIRQSGLKINEENKISPYRARMVN